MLRLVPRGARPPQQENIIQQTPGASIVFHEMRSLLTKGRYHRPLKKVRGAAGLPSGSAWNDAAHNRLLRILKCESFRKPMLAIEAGDTASQDQEGISHKPSKTLLRITMRTTAFHGKHNPQENSIPPQDYSSSSWSSYLCLHAKKSFSGLRVQRRPTTKKFT